MAKQGFIIGFSDDTTTSPVSYWAGVAAAQTTELDDAFFVDSIVAARTKAGNLQVEFPEFHIEAYPVTKSITHNSDLGGAGI